ncbi:MAG: bleomycin resistance protein [Alphaproteobacteria bacterium]|nr:bleomycin resistance protein [Alphaproteobacteria bacterium]HCP01503.1 VOC family protein [Rhodospirillaceae bacterium]
MPSTKNGRPPVALGHVSLHVKNVPQASKFMQLLGLRAVFETERFAVLELRGGTHLVLSRSRKKIREGEVAPVDLMVDDIKAMRAFCTKKKLKPSKITSGSVHDSFYVPGPDGWSIKITSSHTSGRPV